MVKVNIDWCKGCGICAVMCPKGIIKVNDKEKAEIIDEEQCIKCRQCEYHCPDFAIVVEEDK